MIPKDKDNRPPGSACGQKKPIGRGGRGTSSFGTDARLFDFPQMITTQWQVMVPPKICFLFQSNSFCLKGPWVNFHAVWCQIVPKYSKLGSDIQGVPLRGAPAPTMRGIHYNFYTPGHPSWWGPLIILLNNFVFGTLFGLNEVLETHLAPFLDQLSASELKNQGGPCVHMWVCECV